MAPGKSIDRSPRAFCSQEVLGKLGEARAALVEAQKSLRPRSGLSRSANAVIAEIDEFAFVVTGSLTYFHTTAHGTPPRRTGDET
ncbi:hypothetical protein [Labrenzia sp. VG12]|uniref:hypothetical protein n=1 Tax=Labrenzia sp. VG12 TaxID=2021862 RepID=UPI001AD8A2C4|nr:hypothetical protein [Labrenzia sp. VG12]